jgi:hypothetical protein
MQKPLFSLLFAALLAVGLVQPVFAANRNPPVGSCPNGFTLMVLDEHMDHHDFHIGLSVDLNGDGLICMMSLSNGLHVHMDNVLG